MIMSALDAAPLPVIVHIKENDTIVNNIVDTTTLITVVERCFNQLKKYWNKAQWTEELITIGDMYEDLVDIIHDEISTINELDRTANEVEDQHICNQFLDITKKIAESIQDFVIFKYTECNEELNNVDISILDKHVTLFQVTPYFTPRFN